MAISLSTATRNAMADAAVDLIDVGAGANGTIVIYDGAQPTDANTAITTQVDLATFQLAAPAFGAASSGTASLPGTLTTTGTNTGTASWFRVYDKDGVGVGNVIFDGSVTATSGGGELELNTTSISTGVNVEITTGTFTMPAA